MCESKRKRAQPVHVPAKVAKLIEKTVQSGKADLLKPKEVYQLHSSFKLIPLGTFRDRLRRVRLSNQANSSGLFTSITTRNMH